MLTKLTAFFTAFVIFLGSFSLISEPSIPEASSEKELLKLEGVIEKKTLGDEIFAVDMGNFSSDERIVAVAIQGIVAKTNPCIYLITNSTDREYLSEIEKVKTVHYESWNLASLLTKFKSYIGDTGYILYRNSDYAEGLNVATNYATVYRWLPVPKELEQVAKDCGLTLKKDISADDYNLSFQQKHWEELRDNFRKGIVVHEKTTMPGLRDLAIQQNIYCFYTDGSSTGNSYVKKILNWSGKNTSILGWVEYEKHFVEYISKLGSYVTPSDYCFNISILSSFETEIPDINDTHVASTDPTKHYVTIVFSDGDNCQWIQNGYAEYYETLNNYPQSKITWTFSPFLQELCPLAVKRIYSDANENQTFISGPSGIAYYNPSIYDASALDLVSTRTASAMLKSNQRILTILDDYTLLKDKKFSYRLGYYSRFDNIDGGILYLDPGKYQSGKGKVWFSNDKPFASVRLSLWADGGYEDATDEWITEQANIINSYPADINSINGYSVINVHAWSVNSVALQKFISQLDDDVVILNADDFLATMSANIPHKDATPDEY